MLLQVRKSQEEHGHITPIRTGLRFSAPPMKGDDLRGYQNIGGHHENSCDPFRRRQLLDESDIDQMAILGLAHLVQLETQTTLDDSHAHEDLEPRVQVVAKLVSKLPSA